MKHMTGFVSALAPSSILTGITVMKDGSNYVLCPFFGKCDGVLVMESARTAVAFIPNTNHNPELLSNLIIESKIKRLICGFVPRAECQQRLHEAGIDVRFGSGAYAVNELVVAFANLPGA